MEDLEFTPALMTDPKMILAFIFAGNATLTFRSVQSGTRYTYKVKHGAAKEGDNRVPPFFVSLLTGSDNENDYTYMGMILADTHKFRTTKATKNPTSQPIKGFEWALNILEQGRMPQGLEIWHEGRCARCNRKLTDPDSIATGFGPECIKHGVGLNAMKAVAAIKPGLMTSTATMDAMKASPVYAKPTPASIVAAVTEDPKIKQMADALWAKHPANPVNAKPVVAAEPLPVDQKAAEALAKSQGWTVAEATEQLGRRKVVNMNLTKKTPSKAEKAVEDIIPATEPQDDPAVLAMVESLKANVETYTMDGIMDEVEAFNFWYRRFKNDSSPVGV
jgi:hypothetical protein